MSSLQFIAGLPGLLYTVRVATIASLLFISGLSFCLSQWVIPNMHLAPPISQLQQFTATFTKGAKFLMPGGRLIMAGLVTNAVLTAYHPDAEVSSQWGLWTALGVLMITAAPYEIIFIFPINDRAKELQKQVETDRRSLKPNEAREIRQMIDKWAARNYVRVLLPLIAGLIGLWNV